MSSYQSQMKVPIRPAPPPPVNQKVPPKSISTWDSFGDADWNKSAGPQQKKKPPPRPPPPKFPSKKSAPSRPSQLIAGLFQRKNNTNAKPTEIHSNKPPGDLLSDSKATNGSLLIDFTSPPSSPTFTTRSSSDALSVNSFGSDGVTQYSNSSGNASNVESGFEDDFDVFSTGSKRGENGFQPRDPWSPPPKAPEPKYSSTKSWATFPSPAAAEKPLPVTVAAIMPTIIRSKPDLNPKPQTKSVSNCDTRRSNLNILADVFQSVGLADSKGSTTNGLSFDVDEEEDADDGWSSESPPMPTCPPPPPPPATSDIYAQEVICEEDEPSGVALYDYPGEADGDLSFRANEVIYLVRKIDENWLVGRCKDGREGSVPANFLSIRVPLAGEEEKEKREEDAVVRALYAFQAETWDDLVFEEGSVIKVTHRIDNDWLYGECNGKCGQFPANFVDRVPRGLPMRR